MISCPFSSLTLNWVLGRVSVTVPSISMPSSFATIIDEIDRWRSVKKNGYGFKRDPCNLSNIKGFLALS